MKNSGGKDKETGERKRQATGLFGIRKLKRMYHETIKGKITISVLLLVLVSLSLLGIISSILNNHSTNSTLERSMEATAKVCAERVEWEITSYKNIAEDLGMTARLANDAASTEDKMAIINERVRVNELTAGGILDRAGVDIFTGESCSGEKYFQEAIKGQTYVTEPMISEDQSSIEIRIAAPLWKEGLHGTEVTGVIYLVPDEDFLNDIMVATNVSANGSAYMTNGQGVVIAHKDHDLVKKKDNSIEAAKTDSSLKTLARLEQKMIAGETGFGSYRYSGVRKIMAYTPVGNSNNWSIAITAPVSDFNRETIVGIIITILIVLISIVVAVVMVRKLADNIGTPIHQCAERLTALAHGDLHSGIPQITTEDEVLTLANATEGIVSGMEKIIRDVHYILEEMSGNNFAVHSKARESYVGDFENILQSVRGIKYSLTGTLNQIRESADRVGLGSSQLADSAQSLAEGATDQAASVEELLATATDVAQQVERNTEMMYAMGKINDASMQISNIIQTIEVIADQTNLLSLNASIEAARAGEAGRGFAVVAGEIGNLATQCAESVEDTRKLIEAALCEVEGGNKIAEKMAEELQRVINGIDGIVKAVEEAAENSSEQNRSMQKINETIGMISEVVQTNSAAAEESSATSQELSAQATELNGLIGKFQLSDETE